MEMVANMLKSTSPSRKLRPKLVCLVFDKGGKGKVQSVQPVPMREILGQGGDNSGLLEEEDD